MNQELDAKTISYEAEVVPRWTEPFARLLLQATPIEPSAMVLDVLCGTGAACVPLLERGDFRGRVVALDPSSARLAIARRKAGGLVGKRLFFRHEKPERFSFADEVFDVVLSNVGVLEGATQSVLAECVRVTKPAGVLGMTLPLRGTMQEAFELLREVLERRDDEAAQRRLEALRYVYPTDEEAISRFETVGLREVSLTRSRYTLEFPSGRAFVGSELVAQLFVEAWSRVAGNDAPAVLAELGHAIDTYYARDPFEVTIEAACLVGHREEVELLEEVDSKAERRALLEAEVAEVSDDEATPVRAIAIPDEASRVGPAPAKPGSAPSAPPSSKQGSAPTPPPPPPGRGTPPPTPAAEIPGPLEGALGDDGPENSQRQTAPLPESPSAPAPAAAEPATEGEPERAGPPPLPEEGDGSVVSQSGATGPTPTPSAPGAARRKKRR